MLILMDRVQPRDGMMNDGAAAAAHQLRTVTSNNDPPGRPLE